MAQFRFGDFDFPDRLIKHSAVNVKPNQRQSMDAYTDMYGETHDNPLPHTKSEIQFTTLDMSGDELRHIMSEMVRNYKNYLMRNADCRYYDDENGIFKEGHFYFDKSFQFNRKEVDNNGIPTEYGEMQWTFIEY